MCSYAVGWGRVRRDKTMAEKFKVSGVALLKDQNFKMLRFLSFSFNRYLNQ